MSKTKVGVIFGGRSEEHEISLKSAESVIKALNSDKFVPVYIGITKEGCWKRFRGEASAIADGSWEISATDFELDDLKEQMDFALPILHGPYGEDGCIQGFFEILDIPYGGCGVLASAVAMDKQLFKELMRQKDLPVCKDLCFTAEAIGAEASRVVEQIEKELGFPCFVKPANMGSSVGVTKVKRQEELAEALAKACRHDRRIVVEQFIPCRELEVSIIGNQRPVTSTVGEIIPSEEFYDYQAKYSGKREPSRLCIPADIEPKDEKEIKELALKAYEVIDGMGYARVDFFKHKETGKIYINEINTIPGFTDKSMFPLLWQDCGNSYSETIERIINLGYERYYTANNRQTTI